MSADPRSRAQRRRDTEHRLTHDKDVWVASASADGAPYLVPLSFDWDGEALLMATPTDSPIGRNLATTRAVRLGLGHTRDVEVVVFEIDALPQERGDRFVAPPRPTPPIRWTADRCRDRVDEGEPDVLLEAGQIEPGDADGDREGGPA
jgi:hypothetical protein